jgi:signal transduction histidine kinase
VIVLAVVATAAVALAAMWSGAPPTTALRHLYLVPAVTAALASGPAAGASVGLLGGLLHALLVLPEIEAQGLSSTTADGLVGLVAPAATGWFVGTLRARVRTGARRLAAVLEIERSVAEGAPLESAMTAAARHARRALGAQRLALILSDGGALRVFGEAATRVTTGSAAAWALERDRPVRTLDLEGDRRFRVAGWRPAPVRALALPLRDPDGETAGLLAAEWEGGRPDHAVAAEVALVLSLVIVNARLRLRQQRGALELEERVLAATETLRELDRAKSEFVSTVSHELRTPLTALQGFSELLLERAVPPERARRFLGHIHAESQRLARTVAELLDVSRIEAGRGVELRVEAVDLREAAETNVEMFAAGHPAHRFEWVASGLALARADRDAVDRVLKNLLSNAVKYSPRGGSVRIVAGPAPGRPDMVAMIVEDEGVGIPREAQSRIFERYVRLAHPDTVGVRGLGLGLCLVRALAEAQGGSVSVESQDGQGTRFQVLLPRWTSA